MTQQLLRSMDEIVAAMHARKEELNISNELIDDIAGMPARYTSKVFARMKSPGYVSLGPLLETLGLGLQIVEDPAALDRIKHRFQPRKRNFKPSLSISLSIQAHGTKHVDISTKNKMAELGRKGGKKRLVTLSRKRRREIARQAIRARWAKARAEAIAP